MSQSRDIQEQKKEEAKKYCEGQVALYNTARYAALGAAISFAAYGAPEAPLALAGWGLFSLARNQKYEKCMRREISRKNPSP